MSIPANKSTSVVLVTGGTGFVGSYVIRDLINKGYTVKALRRKSSLPFYIDAGILNQAEWIDCDIMDTEGLAEAMHETDIVIHSAARVSFSEKDREEMYRTNVEGTANIVNTAIDKNIKRFVYVSSVAAIGRKSDGTEVREDYKWEENKLHTHYAISKYYGEMEVWRGIGEGLNAVIVSPSTILGFGDWHCSSAALFRNIYNGFPWYTNGVNGFVDIEDVSRAIVMLMESEIQSERFILNGDNWSYKKLLDAIADGLNKKRPTREATPFLAACAWRAEKLKSLLTGKNALLTRESARVARSNTRFSNSKITQAFPGFRFTPIEETINKACIRYLRANDAIFA